MLNRVNSSNSVISILPSLSNRSIPIPYVTDIGFCLVCVATP